MGVINNLIKINKIVGKNWDGTTLEDILKVRPIPAIQNIADTSADSVIVRSNIVGFIGRLYAYENNAWVLKHNVTSAASNAITVALTSITTTSVCRFALLPLGGNSENVVYSNEFTVTRTAAQTQSFKGQEMKENLSETSDLKDETI